MEVWFQADILSGKAGSQEETLRADGDSSPERGKGCDSHIVGKDRPGGRLLVPISAVVSAFTSAVVGALRVWAADGARTTHL